MYWYLTDEFPERTWRWKAFPQCARWGSWLRLVFITGQQIKICMWKWQLYCCQFGFCFLNILYFVLRWLPIFKLNNARIANLHSAVTSCQVHGWRLPLVVFRQKKATIDGSTRDRIQADQAGISWDFFLNTDSILVVSSISRATRGLIVLAPIKTCWICHYWLEVCYELTEQRILKRNTLKTAFHVEDKWKQSRASGPTFLPGKRPEPALVSHPYLLWNGELGGTIKHQYDACTHTDSINIYMCIDMQEDW